MNLGRGHLFLGGTKFLRQSVDDFAILGRVFGVRGMLVMTRATDEVRALRMLARQRPRGDTVTIYVEIARETLDTLEGGRVEHFPPIRPIRVVPR